MRSRRMARVSGAVSLIAVSVGLFLPAQAQAQDAAREKPAASTTRTSDDDQERSNDIVVTARKREETIQSIPQAITAVSMEELTTRQVTGGPDLMTQVPNMTFTKTNFSGYSIQIRGIGTQAISATTDPAVSVALNNTPFIRNRFFEQEFYDLERIEILRGPQGTLYGRNATAGVVNLISAKPKFEPSAKLSVDAGTYHQIRTEGMINIPLLEDKLALRLAGAWTKRDGYVYNSIADKQTDGRNLWSTRASLLFMPTDRFEANLVWEHFNEDDDRLRSGKQLCATDEKTEVAGFPVTHLQTFANDASIFAGVQASFSQGCKAASLYAPESFQTPNGLSLPYYVPLGVLGLPVSLADPYAGRSQSTDLRTIESTIEPSYRARSNIFELQLGWQVRDNLKLTSETAYNTDFTFSTQDFNRFNTAEGAFRYLDSLGRPPNREGLLTPGSLIVGSPAFGVVDSPNGIFCDPQIGCTDRLAGADLSTARSTQFSQELRLTSSNDGPFNFSLGVNYLRYRTDEKYYVFFNSLTMLSALAPQGGQAANYVPYVGGVTDNRFCMTNGLDPADATKSYQVSRCSYIDPNPIDSLNGQGHNYFLSNNPYTLNSYSIFGEAYYDITDTLRLTAGGRLTRDKKVAPRILSELLASDSFGYPVAEVIEQRWTKPTGKISLDWKPDLGFTDSTLLYASVSRGYKAGGANPPGPGYVYYASEDVADGLAAISATHPKTFAPEYVNAFEIGAKNTLAGGKLTINLAGFFYDYKGYQVSQIVDRSASNLNFDAKIWGAELETSWNPTRNLQLGLKLGYQGSRLAKGSRAIDLMDRTAGDPNWTLMRPFPTSPSSCILPTSLFQGVDPNTGKPVLVTLGWKGGGNPGGCEAAYVLGLDPVTFLPYVPNPTVVAPLGSVPSLEFHPGYAGWDPSTAPNHGEGIYKDLSGNELPNAPHVTASVTADYSVPLGGDWIATLHGDYYYQSASWGRIYNTPGYDRIRGYSNVNLALLLNNRPGGWSIMAYVKNVFDKTAITGTFLNSDDTGLTTNIFLTEPRRYGLRVTKEFNGLPFGLGYNAGTNHTPGTPWPITIEGGVDLLRRTAHVAPHRPAFAFDAYAGGNLDAAGPMQRDRGLGTKDGTDIALIVQPAGTPWKLTANLRYGKVQGATRYGRQETKETKCLEWLPGYGGCDPGSAYLGLYTQTFTNFGDASIQDSEKHLMLDFIASHDVGIGSRGRSSIGLGARLARLDSDTRIDVSGRPDFVANDDMISVGIIPFHKYQAFSAIDRSFSGAGPIAQWEGSYDLFGSDETGKVALDWSATGGVLFGKRKAQIVDDETVYNFTDTTEYVYERIAVSAGNGNSLLPSSVDKATLRTERKHRATVPTLGGSLGLSYSLGRVAVKTGYRWERYWRAIDGGDTTGPQNYDRTIHGPYIKLSIGFGK